MKTKNGKTVDNTGALAQQRPDLCSASALTMVLSMKVCVCHWLGASSGSNILNFWWLISGWNSGLYWSGEAYWVFCDIWLSDCCYRSLYFFKYGLVWSWMLFPILIGCENFYMGAAPGKRDWGGMGYAAALSVTVNSEGISEQIMCDWTLTECVYSEEE